MFTRCCKDLSEERQACTSGKTWVNQYPAKEVAGDENVWGHLSYRDVTDVSGLVGRDFVHFPTLDQRNGEVLSG